MSPGLRKRVQPHGKGMEEGPGVDWVGIPSAIHGNIRADVLSKKVPCELHASQVRGQTAIPVRENGW